MARLSQLLIASAAAALVVLLVAGAAVNAAYQNRVLPGVHYAELPFSGLSEPEVSGLLDSHVSAFLSSPATFTYGEKEWHPSATEMGLHIDTQEMARDALHAGRTAPVPVRWITSVLALPRRPEVPLRASIDQSQLSAYLGAIALEMDRAPVSAALGVRNGQIVAGQSSPGRQVDAAATAKNVRLPRSVGDVQRVEVVLQSTVAPLDESGAVEARAQLTKILSGPLTLRARDSTWTLTPAALGAMVDVKPISAGPGGGQKLAASLNEAKVASFVSKLAAQFDQEAEDARFRWTGSGLALIRESKDGVKLDQKAAIKAIIAHAGQDTRDITLDTSVVKPAVRSDEAASLGIKDLVSTGSSKFAGSSPERASNIAVAAARLNGSVIPVGSTFSFLSALGPITKENGYQEGLTIQGDATVPGIGGGVCQVSTTAFRAAFYAGLPIVERHQHTYRVGYYEQDGSPVGFDAAVYDPGVDLRFKNDTGAAILIQTAYDASASKLTFSFYGAASGREVKLAPTKANEVKAGPPLPDVLDPTLPKGVRKQLEWRADGVDATVRRTVVQSGQTLLSDSFFSRYVPWQEKWAVGTGGGA